MGTGKSKMDESDNTNSQVRKVTDDIAVERIIKYFLRGQRLQNADSNTAQIFPEPIIGIIYDYYHLKFIWDLETNKDKQLSVSERAQKLTTKADSTIYSSHRIYSSIFMNEWMSNNGNVCKYYFRFKLHGQPSFDNAIAIGIVNEKYDMSHAEGIGYDKNGWSFYVWGKKDSCVYCTDYTDMLNYTVSDGSIFSFEITIKDDKCSYALIVNDNDKKLIEFDEIKPPIKLGASIHTKTTPLSLEIIEYKVEYQ